jgi:hypothetical protein
VVIAWGLFSLRRWALRALPITFLSYEAAGIGQRILWSPQAGLRENLPFTIGLAVIALAIIIWITTRLSVRIAFERADNTPQFDPGEP